MHVEELDGTSVVYQVGTMRGYRSAESQLAQQERLQRRRALELNADNYRDARLEIPATMIRGGPKSGRTTNSRRVLASRKTLQNHLDEDIKGYAAWQDAAAPPSRYPAVALCSTCGDEGNYKCQRCGFSYCSLRCETTHVETFCLK